MIRLLQGDVGSGKTIVALISMIKVFESNFQSALMVPTTILAFQHYENIINLLKNSKINVLVLTGKDKGKERKEKLDKIRPSTLSQASRISGIKPSDISVLLVKMGR